MFDRSIFRDLMAMRGAAARRVHSLWLSRAMRRGVRVARIPTRQVSEGGFAPVMATVEGREWAEAWWEGVLGEEVNGER